MSAQHQHGREIKILTEEHIAFPGTVLGLGGKRYTE